MNYSKITCSATGRDMKADKIFKVRNDNCIENVVSVCYSCPYSDSKMEECKNCYGTICQNTVHKINEETKRVKMSNEDIRNTFIRVGEDIIKFMDADEFLNNLDIISNLNTSNWCHGQRINDKLIAWDRSRSWKTECQECKKRYSENGTKTPCEKAKSFVEENGINLSTASEKQIKDIELPQDCICQECTQQMYYV